MYQVVGYHRPTSLPDVLQMLGSGQRVPLAGGVHLHHDGGGDAVEVVDLQSAGLDALTVESGTARVGAMVRLQQLVDDPRLPDAIREAARSEHPSTLRTLATIGGTIATASGDSLLLAALLVHHAVVRVAADGNERSVALDDLLDAGRDAGELIVDVEFETTGTGAIACTGRTPRDIPIVGAVARQVDGSNGSETTLAVCGVGVRPLLVEPGGHASLQPLDDHRATAAYRLHLAEVLTDRVLERLS